MRARAAAEDTKATAWIRALIEAELSAAAPNSTEARLRRLEAAVFEHSA
ncbi:hypothetical protein [Saccharopolyspora erythraea]|uniref:Uncharacterized protein n=1 Tax=Saccharopolyspora erythraea TaxID=1836 RepID=A0ABN1DSZ8_SACER|nr:hypothetical protein [Saccharopolyspora erythraea]EQD82898.1 hypothetical protein N599_28230 [Saccharopolyspora erythraea D]QRK89216.1 hypothetical protein JQX30_32390 [Saccharopolyspora erythraea]